MIGYAYRNGNVFGWPCIVFAHLPNIVAHFIEIVKYNMGSVFIFWKMEGNASVRDGSDKRSFSSSFLFSSITITITITITMSVMHALLLHKVLSYQGLPRALCNEIVTK